LLLVNPPHHFTARAELWQQELRRVLDPAQRGGSSVHALTRGGSSDDTGT
jgi:hypothetical protein